MNLDPYKLLEFAFIAGGILSVFRRVVKDLNGLGRRVREDRLVDDVRYFTIACSAIALEKDEANRRWLAERFISASKRSS